MSLQVGAFCYATPADAGRAACSQFQSVSTINAQTVSTVSCASADSVSGALNLTVSSVDTITGASSVSFVQQQIAFSDCAQTDLIVAGEVIISALLGVWITWVMAKKMLSFLGWSRGEL